MLKQCHFINAVSVMFAVKRPQSSAFASTFGAAFAVAFLNVGVAYADSETAAQLLELAGIPPHLGVATDAIREEGFARYTSCLSADELTLEAAKRAEFGAMIERHFGQQHSVARAIDTMATNMNDEQMRQAREFFATELGQKIAKVEKDSKDIGEDEFVELVNQYVESAAWSPERKSLIGELSNETRAVRFVSLINGEITVAAKVSSACVATDEGYSQLSAELKRERTDARFIEPIMSGGLNLVIATIFRDLSDEEINDYLEFSRSEAGVSFFNSLLQSTRRAIAGGLKGVREERIATYEGD